MNRSLVCLLLVAVCLTGCIQPRVRAPGVKGTVVDAATGKPVIGAGITRPQFTNSVSWKPLPIGGLAPVTVRSARSGDFNLRPDMIDHIAELMVLPNPEKVWGSFIVSADGYLTQEVSGFATSQTSWCVEAGRVLLKRVE